mgnify:CR=1 FL=1
MILKLIQALIRSGSGKFLVIVLIALLGFFLFKKFSQSDKVVITHDALVEKIESMGKMELTKFTIKNVLSKQIVKEWWPDSKVLFIAVGEAVGCIDLTKINKNDVKRTGDSITINLPKPEICYIKLNHEKSKVYDISGVYFKEDTKQIVEEVYQLAEKELEKEAKEMGIIAETEKNARLILKPIFETISGKKVVIKVKMR